MALHFSNSLMPTDWTDLRSIEHDSTAADTDGRRGGRRRSFAVEVRRPEKTEALLSA